LKSTNLNRIQVTTLTCCNIQVKQRYCHRWLWCNNRNPQWESVLCRHVNCLSRVLDVPTPVTTWDRYVPYCLLVP